MRPFVFKKIKVMLQIFWSVAKLYEFWSFKKYWFFISVRSLLRHVRSFVVFFYIDWKYKRIIRIWACGLNAVAKFNEKRNKTHSKYQRWHRWTDGNFFKFYLCFLFWHIYTITTVFKIGIFGPKKTLEKHFQMISKRGNLF